MTPSLTHTAREALARILRALGINALARVAGPAVDLGRRRVRYGAMGDRVEIEVERVPPSQAADPARLWLWWAARGGHNTARTLCATPEEAMQRAEDGYRVAGGLLLEAEDIASIRALLVKR